MNWYTLKSEFNKKFPDWTIKIDPPCISNTRYTHYYYEVLANVLGKKNSYKGYIDIDEDHKLIVFHR